MKRLTLFALTLCLSLACTSQEPGTPKADAPRSQDSEAKGEGDNAEPDGPKLPDGAELLAGHVEAAGGSDAIATFESLHATGTVDAPDQKLRGTMEMWWTKAGHFYLEQEIEGVGKSRAGYDGEIVWAEDPITGLRKLDGQEAASYIQNSMMFPAHQWKDHFEAATTKGKTTLEDGSEVWEVELESADGPNVTVGLDAQTKLIRFMKTKQVTMMGEMPFEAYAENYEAVEGYKFAMKKHSVVTGLLELDEVITSFEANQAVPDGLFAFPSKRPVVDTDPSQQDPVKAPE